ncbi:MAG: DNA mismatch repair protein MutS [Muribaculaceae bacterium]|nr:DNA mismatch repair protein MutS [Muribaculaceae bacterium]
MQLKNVIESPCGLRFMLDQLELQSGFARRWLLDSSMMTSDGDITRCYDVLHRFVDFVGQADKTRLDTLLFKLQGLKDIRTTIKNLHNHATLDDIELFEVKHLAILATDVARLLHEHEMDSVVEIPDLDEVISILDPDGMKIATFYIYDSYCAQLKELRARMRQHPEQQDDLMLEAGELEEGVRKDLSQQLHPFATAIEQAQIALACIDVNLAKAMQMRQMGLCFPVLSPDGTSRYEAMFHPQVKAALADHGKTFQPVNIGFGLHPTLITGANMGGKTVVLKTLTLCQLLFQFGFGIPAASAQIALKDEIHFCIGDEQSVEKGLSSFAAEMKNIDAVIKASREDKKLLALIDEPARTTNPTEGAALVTALLQVLAGRDMSLVMTTHYDIEPGEARCLRVKGFENGEMDYQLVEVHDGEVPHEALNIAQSLGIDTEWIDTARSLIDSATENRNSNH